MGVLGPKAWSLAVVSVGDPNDGEPSESRDSHNDGGVRFCCAAGVCCTRFAGGASPSLAARLCEDWAAAPVAGVAATAEGAGVAEGAAASTPAEPGVPSTKLASIELSTIFDAESSSRPGVLEAL